MSLDADIITSVRSIRKLVVTLDSLGFPISEISKDKEIVDEIPDGISEEISSIASKIHSMLQNIEKSKRYRDAIKHLCEIKERP